MTENSVVNLGSLAKPVEILVERFCDGVGGIFKPRQIRRVAQAEADAEIIKVRNDFEKNRLIASLESGQTDVGRRAIARMIEQEVKHQLNMEEILGNAIENVLPTAKPEEIDSDFISTVFEKCKNVSSVELQSLWGKIIAQEANAPRLRTH